MKNFLLPDTKCFHGEKMGTILIVDISGFSRFVQRVEQSVGVKVVRKLLRTIIEANRLGLQVAEIEGDAILFYRYGGAPSAAAIKGQFEVMLAAFSAETNRIAATVPLAASLSIKMVATCGALTSFPLAGFEKLYGEAVIKAHRLLKNNIESPSYVLITEDLLTTQEVAAYQTAGIYKKCQVYDVGLICYRYTDYFGAGEGSGVHENRLAEAV